MTQSVEKEDSAVQEYKPLELYYEEPMARVYYGDSRDLSALYPEYRQKVALVLTSPPYWSSIDYENEASQIGFMQMYDSYLEDLERVIVECIPLLMLGGKFMINVADVYSTVKFTGRIQEVHLIGDIVKIMEKHNLPLFARYIGKLTMSYAQKVYAAASKVPNIRSLPDFEYYFVFSKGGNRKTEYNEKRTDYLWEAGRGVWDMKHDSDNVFKPSRGKKHPAMMPLTHASKIVAMYSIPGDIVFDPFCGAGTTIVAANRQGRYGIAVDLSETYCNMTMERLMGEPTRRTVTERML